MRPKTGIDFGGRKVSGVEVDFTTKGEQWNVYELEDGTVLRTKSVMVSVLRLEEYNTQGEPIYLIGANQIVAVTVPENLQKQQD